MANVLPIACVICSNTGVLHCRGLAGLKRASAIVLVFKYRSVPHFHYHLVSYFSLFVSLFS